MIMITVIPDENITDEIWFDDDTIVINDIKYEFEKCIDREFEVDFENTGIVFAKRDSDGVLEASVMKRVNYNSRINPRSIGMMNGDSNFKELKRIKDARIVKPSDEEIYNLAVSNLEKYRNEYIDADIVDLKAELKIKIKETKSIIDKYAGEHFQ